MQRQPSSRDTATRDATTEPRHPLSITVAIHTQQSPTGFLVSPSPTDNVCNVPHRRAFGLNGITSHANLFTDTRHATIGATHTYRSPDSLVHCRPHPVSKAWCPFDTTRQGLRRFARELSCSVGSTTRTSGASLSYSCVATQCCCCCARWQVTPPTMAT